MRIALVLVGVSPLEGGGGAERYFADFAYDYANSPESRHALTLVTDVNSLAALEAAGRHPEPSATEVLPSGRVAQARALFALITSGRFDVVHLALPLPRHLSWLFAAAAARRRRPAVAINLNDTRVAYPRAAAYGMGVGRLERFVYALYFSFAPIDGIYTWYEAFAEAYPRRHPRRSVRVHAARYCYVDPDRFAPEEARSPWCVFCGRLVDVKRPLAYVEAVAAARARSPEALAGWQFLIYGRGPLESEVEQAIRAHGLTGLVVLNGGPPLTQALARARVFVSTQDLDNFSSLAMLEAMSAGAAIVAADVGRTRLFVRDGINGVVIRPDCEDLADVLVDALGAPERLEDMGRAGRRLVETEFCFANAREEFEGFWEGLAARE